MKKQLFYLVVTVFVGLSPVANSFAKDMCGIAKEIAEKGIETFTDDPKVGIKILLKAESLCGEPHYKYNLGIAYYRYGNFTEAERYLREAVKIDDKNALWLNNLAWVLLNSSKNYAEAATVARQAIDADENYPPAYDTLARAEILMGNLEKGFQLIDAAMARWEKDALIKRSRDEILSTYISHFLKLIKAGDIQAGLEGLKKVDHEPQVAKIFLQVLARLGRLDKALEYADVAVQRFPGSNEFKDLKQEMFSRRIQQFYIDFKQGQPELALQSAKLFSENNPQSGEAKKAYDDLFNAYIVDATSSLKIPDVESQGQGPSLMSTDAGIDTLLSSIGSANSSDTMDTNLTSDVDINIPKSRTDNPNGVAVVIGNQKYRTENRGLYDVSYAERDALVMRKYLETTLGYHPQNIILEMNVTSGDLRNIFGSQQNMRGRLHRFIRKRESDVFVYYVGHGGPGPDGKTAYLVPIDAQVDFIENNGYPLDLLYSILETLEARKVTVVLDACFSGNSASGPIFRNISPAMLKTAQPAKEMANTIVFCAADKDQVATWYPAKRHSLFTYYFLKGLQGIADKDNNKMITVGEMERYLQEEVPYWAGRISNREQNPLVRGVKTEIIAVFE